MVKERSIRLKARYLCLKSQKSVKNLKEVNLQDTIKKTMKNFKIF